MKTFSGIRIDNKKRKTKFFDREYKKWFFQCFDPDKYVGEVKGHVYSSQDICMQCEKDCFQKEELRRVLSGEEGR
jgi:hypothetical protein